MAAGSHVHRCAVLIDDDNVPSQFTGALLCYASSLGRIDALEMVANFASTSNSKWAVQMREHRITGFQHYSATTGKNTTDIVLSVRAMELLHTGHFDMYLLVSSDSDFSALAHRLRRSGASVHGIGSMSAAGQTTGLSPVSAALAPRSRTAVPGGNRWSSCRRRVDRQPPR